MGEIKLSPKNKINSKVKKKECLETPKNINLLEQIGGLKKKTKSKDNKTLHSKSTNKATTDNLANPSGKNIKYPVEFDLDFYKKIGKIYKNYKIIKAKKTIKDICFPEKFKLQIPQKFLAEYINPNTPYKELLVFHNIGSGKTCGSIQIGESWKHKRKIIIAVPASLIINIRGELRSECAGNEYLTPQERKKLASLNPASKEYKKIIKISDERIDKYYTILSYNKFMEYCEKKEISFKKSVLIIDEIQNLISEEGKYYQILLKTINSAPSDLRICLLSATPIFDKPTEIALLLNLLRPDNLYPIGHEFINKFTEIIKGERKAKNLELFKKMAKGKISYFRGAPPTAFPEQKLRIVKCPMEEFQYRAYKKVLENDSAKSKISNKKIEEADIIDLPNNFFIGSRMISNIAFPNMKIGETGFKSLNKKSLKDLSNLKKYSVKFYKIIKKIKKCKGTVFVYSNFKEYGGIKSFMETLKTFGYKNYKDKGAGKNRFAIWSGDENNDYKDEIKAVFNNKNNYDGSKIKIILGTPSIREGVSLLRVKQAHVLEPYWNWSRMSQVIGRVVRFCSHKDVPKDERYVDVYIYVSTLPKKYQTEKNKDFQTVDEYIQELANNKRKITKEFEHALKEAAVDCELNLVANSQGEEKEIKCS